MRWIRNYLRRYARRKHVRPWALAAPIVVLLIALPLLRPLRHPVQALMSENELARWATVQALVEQQTFSIDQTIFYKSIRSEKVRIGDAFYSDQPPVFALLVSGPYWVMHHYGYTFARNPALVEYLLTMLAVTIPVAAAAGLVYRMGRLFELRRPLRTVLAISVILGCGILSYATVLNPFAPAAALVMAAAAVLVQVSLVHSPIRSGGYLAASGLLAALATAIDPAAIVFAILFIAVILAMHWRWSLKFAGILMYLVGTLPPVLLHVALSFPITGDWKLGLTQLPRVSSLVIHPRTNITSATPPKSGEADDDLLTTPPTAWQLVGAYLWRFCGAFFGEHGLLVHYPILIFGILGVTSVMHRHWPGATKTLAIATCAGSIIVILRYVALPVDWRWAMFAVRWYVVFLPMLLFWAGAWMRKPHRRETWAVVGVLLMFSIVVSIIGATNPTPRDGYDRYTAAAALHQLSTASDDLPALAGK